MKIATYFTVLALTKAIEASMDIGEGRSFLIQRIVSSLRFTDEMYRESGKPFRKSFKWHFSFD